MKKIGLIILLIVYASAAFSEERIIDFVIEGNAKVESEAILNVISLKKSSPITSEAVAKDIRALFSLDYFSDIRFFKETTDKGIIVKIKVVEKPAVVNIRFEGLDELKEDDIRNILDTKPYTIVKERTISSDVRKIEKKYAEKGFYLAKVDYLLEEKSKNEVELVFKIDEKGKVLVGDVFILGNNFFSNTDIIDNLATRPYTRQGAYGSSSLFQKDLLNRDVEFISFYYKDNGFANVKVASPITQMDSDQRYVRVTFQVEEGTQYYLGKLSISEDGSERLLQEEDLLNAMQLKNGKLFRYSKFIKDIELLSDRYGDLGFAYADVNPKTNFDEEKKTVDIHFDITKGQKVYFGQFVIMGNTKTRDNVIRREFDVHESELYSGTRLTKSKSNINRLGFFEEVQVIKERSSKEEDLVDLKIKVKEKPTGQVQASLGFSPAGERKQSWFGQARYDEKNQSGRGWGLNVTGRWAKIEDFDIEVGFVDPKVNDSPWSLGVSVSHRRFIRNYTSDIEVPESQSSASLTVGRDIIELIRGTISFKYTYTKQLKEIFIFEGFTAAGVKRSLTFGLSRRDLDNYIDPSQGTQLNLSHSINGGPLGGDFQYMESLLESLYYIPVDFTETFRTYFRLRGVVGQLWSYKNQPIPQAERYRLGGHDNLRGYAYWSIGPEQRRLRSPLTSYYNYQLGGDKELFFQFEYLLPLIPKAGIKAVFFADAGRSFHETESLTLQDLQKDVGFGFRWLTPIAPFRFEWAYPYDDQRHALGDLQFIFTLGY